MIESCAEIVHARALCLFADVRAGRAVRVQLVRDPFSDGNIFKRPLEAHSHLKRKKGVAIWVAIIVFTFFFYLY
jgi:hypothetical protein